MSAMEAHDSVIDPLRNPDSFEVPETENVQDKISNDEKPLVEKTTHSDVPTISELLLEKIIKYTSLLGNTRTSGNECEHFWSDFFEKHFQMNKEWMSISDDDLLYYVKKGT